MPQTSLDKRQKNILETLPDTFYEAGLEKLKAEFRDKKAALDRQKESANLDSEIIKATFVGTVAEYCKSVSKNELKGEPLHFWIKQLGRATVHCSLCEIISSYQAFFRENKFITPGEIISIADFFIDRYPYSCRFSELIYFMNQGVAGRWGKIYGDLTAAIFFEWWVKYEQELAGQREDEHVTRKDITRPVVEKIEDLFKGKFMKWNGTQAKQKVAPDEKWFDNQTASK